MANTDKLEKIKTEYRLKRDELTQHYRELIEQEYIDILKSLNMYNTDIINKKTGICGQIKVFAEDYTSVDCEYKFIPYKKDGKLANKYTNIYAYSSIESLKIKLSENFEPC